MEVALMEMLKPALFVNVNHETFSGNYIWSVTFLSHLTEWVKTPLSIVSGRDGDTEMSKLLSTAKTCSGGHYPISYTLWKTGTYEVSVLSPAGSLVSESTYTIEVENGAVHPTSSIAMGQGLISGTARKEFSFSLQTRDQRQTEVQAVKISADIINVINEVQTIEVTANQREIFTLSFRGKHTNDIRVGTSSVTDLKYSLEYLPTITTVSITTSGALII